MHTASQIIKRSAIIRFLSNWGQDRNWQALCLVMDPNKNNFDRAEASTVPKHQPCQSIGHSEASTIRKHRPRRNIGRPETSAVPKHRPHQRIYRAGASTVPEHRLYPYIKTAFWKKIWKKSKDIKPNLKLLEKMHTIKIWRFKKNDPLLLNTFKNQTTNKFSSLKKS